MSATMWSMKLKCKARGLANEQLVQTYYRTSSHKEVTRTSIHKEAINIDGKDYLNFNCKHQYMKMAERVSVRTVPFIPTCKNIRDRHGKPT